MTIPPRESRRVIVDVDSRGRVSLARFGIRDTQLAVDRLPDGGLVLHEAVALTAAELAHLRDPDAADALERAWEDVAAGRLHQLPD